MSGLLTRSGRPLPRWYPRTLVPNEPETLNAARSDGLSGVWDRLITPSPCCSSRPRPQREVVATVTLKLLCGGHGAGSLVGRVWLERGAPRGAPMLRNAEPLAGLHAGAVVALAAGHELPGDARGLVGERHGGELLGLALQELGQPGRGPGAAAFDLLDVGRGARHQGGAQALVAGAGDAAVSHLAGGRMVLRGEAEPGREPATGSKGSRGADLDGHRAGNDRADRRHLDQAPAQLVGALEGLQLLVELGDARRQVGELLAQGGEQFLGQRRDGLIGRYALEQRLDVGQPLGRNQAELGGMA